MSNARRGIIFIPLLLIAIAAALAVMIPSWREAVQSRLTHGGRTVLATVEGDLLNDGSLVKVVKYEDAEGIYLEVVKIGDKGEAQRVDRVQLPDKHDGLFNFHGHVTRLAIGDIDGDGKMELLAPTFDNQLVPHLNVFRYNPARERFEPYQPGK